MSLRPHLLPVLLLGLAGLVQAGPSQRSPIGPADFAPAVAPAPGQTQVHVGRFLLDRRPVTNGQFLDFVRRHPEWRRDRAPRLLADGEYLSHWSGPETLGETVAAEQPVTRVSWFAARAYCADAGGRLPSWHEWELAAAADADSADARASPGWRARILSWYSVPASEPLACVGQGPPDVHGIYDLHGLVWEWVEDISALMVSGDSRTQGDPDRLAFCGAGALSAQDRENYPMLMRMAFLSSLEANATARSLGFRCAAEAAG